MISLWHPLPILAKHAPWSAIDRTLRQNLTREGMPFTVLPPDVDAINAFADALESLMAMSNSPTRGHPKFPQAGRPDYDDSGVMAMRAAASLSR